MSGLARHVAGLALIAVFATALLLAVTGPSRDRLVEAERNNRETAARVAAIEERLEAARQDAGGPSLAMSALWTGADQSAAEQDLQRAVVAMADAAGMQLNTFGAVRTSDGISRVTFRLEAVATQDAFVRFLEGIARFRPPLAVDELSIRHNPGPDGDVMLSLRITIWGFAQIGDAVR